MKIYVVAVMDDDGFVKEILSYFKDKAEAYEWASLFFREPASVLEFTFSKNLGGIAAQ